MVQYSYPVVNQPLPAEQWTSVTKGVGNGILDQGGFPYRLVFESNANATNQGVIKAPSTTSATQNFGHAILEGFYHRYDADITLSFPAVTVSTTYHVALQYDPSNTTLPVQLNVFKSPLSYLQGRNYLHLYTVKREPNQLLTDADVRMLRPRVAPIMVVTRDEDLPLANKTLWGTLAIIHNGRSQNTGVLKMSMTGDDAESVNGWFWKTIYDPDADDHKYVWDRKDDSSTYVSQVAGGYVRAIGRRGKRRKLRGRVAFADGRTFKAGNSDGYQIFSAGLVESDRPGSTQSFICSIAGTTAPGFARVEITPSGGIYAWPSKECAWISFDGIEWEV